MTQDGVHDQLFSKDILEKWNEEISGRSPYSFPRDARTIPQVQDYKYDILRWLGYWPINLIWTLINDFVKRVSKTIYNMISGMLQSISDKVFSDVRADFK